MKKKWLAFLFFLPIFLHSLEVLPWFGDVYEFNLLTEYKYIHYSRVNRAIVPLKKPSNDHFVYFDLEFPFAPQWSMDVDLYLEQTPRQSFGFSSGAVQFRYLWLDDIIGDWASLATGMNVRFVSHKSLHDISSPFHGNVDFSINMALGKEVNFLEYLCFRFWAYGAFGIANKGSPWINGRFGIDGHANEQHHWSAYIETIHGYGKRRYIDIDHFSGYGKTRQKAVDLSLSYGYQFGVWGTLSAFYQRRLYASTCPSNVNRFGVNYLFLFSF